MVNWQNIIHCVTIGSMVPRHAVVQLNKLARLLHVTTCTLSVHYMYKAMCNTHLSIQAQGYNPVCCKSETGCSHN